MLTIKKLNKNYYKEKYKIIKNLQLNLIYLII